MSPADATAAKLESHGICRSIARCARLTLSPAAPGRRNSPFRRAQVKTSSAESATHVGVAAARPSNTRFPFLGGTARRDDRAALTWSPMLLGGEGWRRLLPSDRSASGPA